MEISGHPTCGLHVGHAADHEVAVVRAPVLPPPVMGAEGQLGLPASARHVAQPDRPSSRTVAAGRDGLGWVGRGVAQLPAHDVGRQVFRLRLAHRAPLALVVALHSTVIRVRAVNEPD